MMTTVQKIDMDILACGLQSRPKEWEVIYLPRPNNSGAGLSGGWRGYAIDKVWHPSLKSPLPSCLKAIGSGSLYKLGRCRYVRCMSIPQIMFLLLHQCRITSEARLTTLHRFISISHGYF